MDPRRFSVMRAGKVAAGPDYGIERPNHTGQDILYCLSGRRRRDARAKAARCEPGQIVWIANEEPHAHFADPISPWTLLWFRLDGPFLPTLRRRLFNAGPLRVSMPEEGIVADVVRSSLRHYARARIGQDLRLNQLVGDFLVDRRPCPCRFACFRCAGRACIDCRGDAEEPG